MGSIHGCWRDVDRPIPTWDDDAAVNRESALHEYRLPRPGNNDNRDGTLECPQLLCLRTACGSIVAVESVGYVILYVRDLDASAAFYQDVVGLPFKFRDAGYAELATGETRFGLLERTRASDLIRREPTEGGPVGEVLFLVDDVDAEVERLRALGVELLSGPVDLTEGRRRHLELRGLKGARPDRAY